MAWVTYLKTKYSTFLIVASVVIGISPIFAQSEDQSFTDWEHHFRVSVPVEFQTKTIPKPNIGVLLVSKQSGYPTFNVLVAPGLYKAGSIEPSIQIKKIVDEYGSVGLSPVTVRNSYRSRVADRNAFTVELEYEMKGETLSSSVTKISGVTQHYILTFMDRTSNFEGSKQLRDDFLNSFATWSDKEIQIKDEPSEMGRAAKIILGSLIAAGFGSLVIAFGYLKRRFSS